MAASPEDRRFRCTECGACCNRSPEVGLSEAASLADQFVFRLTFRLFHLPNSPGAGALSDANLPNAGALLAQRKLLASFACWKKSAKVRRGGKLLDSTQFLVLSALPLEIPGGACSALRDNRCAIYDRRPLACRTVPLHYSRSDALAESVLDRFVSTPGHLCDTGDAAEVLISNGRIVQETVAKARSAAVAAAELDRTWAAAIVQRVKTGTDQAMALPSLGDIQANAAAGALSTSMRAAWKIAVDAGLLPAERYYRLVADQLAVIERELILARARPDDLTTLAEMQLEYRHHLAAAPT